MNTASLAEHYLSKLEREEVVEGDQRVAATVLRAALEQARNEAQVAQFAAHILANGLQREALG